MALFDNKQRLLIIGIFVLTFLILVGSSMSISNYNALQSSATETEDEIQNAIDRLEGSNGWSITMLIISLLVLLSGGGYIGYIKFIKK